MNTRQDDDDKTRQQGGEHRSRAKEGGVVSMHENVPIWHDSCSCEAEPYWCEALGGEGVSPAAGAGEQDEESGPTR